MMYLIVFWGGGCLTSYVARSDSQVVYKQAYDTSHAGRSLPDPTPHPKPNSISRKSVRCYINGGTQEQNQKFIEIFLHFHINGGTQEQNQKFIKIIFQWCEGLLILYK